MGGREALVVLVSVLLALDNVGRSTAADVVTATVLGEGICTDCVEQNQFKGLQVAVVCETSPGKHEAKALSQFNNAGKFSVALPHDLLDSSGNLKHSCFAQLFDPSKGAPCPIQSGLDAFKLVPRPSSSRLFTTASPKLAFSRSACSSAFLWPHPFLPLHPWLNKPSPPAVPCPPTTNPPVFKKPNLPPLPKFPPVTKKPLPPIPKFPPVIKKPLPPVPKFPPVIKKPLPPIPKFPPVIKKPLPPIPKFPPVIKKPLPPIPKFPPVIKKPLPPMPKFPPVIKKPLPPMPKFPPVIKKPLPPMPKFPPLVKKPFPKHPVHPKLGWPHPPKN